MSVLTEKYHRWLKQAYLYYVMYDNTMSDYEWDMIGRELAEKWDEWDSPHKHLVRQDAMFTAYYIPEEDYPKEIVT